MRGVAIVLGASLAAFLISVYGLELLRFSAPAVVSLQILLWLAVSGLVARFLAWPLARRVSDEQAALYLEENEPSLETAVLSALEAGGGSANTSEALEGRLVDNALDRARKIDYGRGIEQKGFYRASGALAAAAFATLALMLLGPVQLRHGASALLFPTRDAGTVNPYSITVEPGDVTIARGSDQLVVAQLFGFASDEVQVFFKSESSDVFDRLSMLPDEAERFELLLLGLDENTEYFVESSGIRSDTHRIEVADLPYVDRLELEYHFPSYTGLAPRTIDGRGDIAALEGTQVKVKIFPTMLTPGGRLLVNGKPAELSDVGDGTWLGSLRVEREGYYEIELAQADGELVPALEGTQVKVKIFPTMLTPGGRLLVNGKPAELSDVGDGTWLGSLRVEREGYYEIELARADGELVPASPKYTIDVLTDQPPSVSFSKPGRDTRASPIEELFLEAKADDDFGISELALIYSVNGEPEDTISLYDSQPMPEVTAGHTLYLEELELEPGDLVSYYAQAKDNNRSSGVRTVTSDIYFVQIRPFRIDYRQLQQAGGGGQMDERGLSDLQRQIVAATFNLVRDKEELPESEFKENVVSVRLAQARVREQVAGLQERLVARGMGADPQFRRIAELLPKAIEEMENAERILEDGEPREAISPEQKALLHLQKAEETYEAVVTQGGQQGGGGGAGASAEDLADLFELELDKLKNQYETLARGERQQRTEQLDETLEKLKELARRQQQQAERQRRAAAQQGGGGASARGQRQLAEETEEAARQLERLARETNDQRLMEASRQLQQAADDMRRSAASSGNQGTADATSALDRLEEARRRLERNRVDRLREDGEDALRRAEELSDEQREIQRQMDRLNELEGAALQESARRLFERKEAMTEELTDLEGQIDRLSADARSSQPEAAEGLREAANSIRDNKLKERVRYSRGLIGTGDQDYTREFEAETQRGLNELGDRLEQAVGAVGKPEDDRRAEALDRTRDLVRGMESISRRLGERGDRGQQGQGERQGQQGQQGQGEGQRQEGQGQRGQQGQQGQGKGQGGDGRLGGSDQGGVGTPDGGGGGRRPGSVSPGDIRQFRREIRERVQEAQELQGILEQEDLEVLDGRQLDEVVAALRALDSERIYSDVAEVKRLQAQIIEGLKQLEFGLRRELEGEDGDRVFVSGSDEVPTGFQKLVDEYYKALSRNPGN